MIKRLDSEISISLEQNIFFNKIWLSIIHPYAPRFSIYFYRALLIIQLISRIDIVNLIANHDARFDESSDSLDLTAREYEKNEINGPEVNFGAQKYCSNNVADIDIEAGLRCRGLAKYRSQPQISLGTRKFAISVGFDYQLEWMVMHNGRDPSQTRARNPACLQSV